MPEAPRRRPQDAVVLHSLSGHVKARPRAVFEALDARFRPAEGSDSLYLADPTAFLIVAQGGWWYRAEYRVVPDESGSHVEHALLNIAQERRLSRLTARKIVEEAPAEFERLLKELRIDLQ